MAVNPYIECAKIINTHGCHGGVKMESWCNTPQELAKLKKVYIKFGNDYKKYKIQKASVYKQFVMAMLSDIDTMDKALELKDKILYAERDDFDLEDGEYFIADLIGMDVIDADNGIVYGKISDVINRGASDIYVVRTSSDERLIPAVPEFIDRVDINKGVFVRPIDGIFD